MKSAKRQCTCVAYTLKYLTSSILRQAIPSIVTEVRNHFYRWRNAYLSTVKDTEGKEKPLHETFAQRYPWYQRLLQYSIPEVNQSPPSISPGKKVKADKLNREKTT